MRKRIHEMSWAFDDIWEQIKDIHEVLKLYEERLRESAEEERTQSILRGQIKLLELAEKDCEGFSERVDGFLRDYLHGRLKTSPEE